MTDTTPFRDRDRDRARDLHARLGQVGRDLPPHVLRRLVVLLGEEEVVHSAFNREYTDAGGISGRLLVWTDALVLQAMLYESRAQPTSSALPSVTIDVWSRSDLAAVKVRDDEGADLLWHRSEGQWALRSTLELTYRGRPEPLLVHGGTGDDPAELLAALRRDLAR